MNTRLLRSLSISALGLAALFPGEALAAPITRSLVVQVYQFCDDAGLNCASTGPAGDAYFASETAKIWSQAGIGVEFNFVGQFNSTAFSYINDSVAGDTFADLHAAYGTHGPSTTIVDIFLIHTVAGAYGEGWYGQGGLVIAMDDVMSFNGGLGRIDTIAHELGHNFGLVPVSLGGDSGGHSASADYLMAAGGTRSVPVTLADINPDGLGLDKIPTDQSNLARLSSLLSDVPADVPEPVSMALVGWGVLAVVMIRHRRGA